MTNGMKFKFSKNLDFQIDAINSIVDIFDSGENIVNGNQPFQLHHQVSPVVANELEIDKARILKNVQAIQERNGIEKKSSSLSSMDFSIEMETGTGKTYVYLRTALELNKRYGLKKFIILVPSVAIREGVMKTIEQTKEHFREMYPSGFSAFEYDSKKLSRVREFAQSLGVQFMVMTIQSFNKKELNIMHQTPDRFQGEKPIGLVAQTRPVVIMDEPQNMESDLSREAIQELKPLFKVRYSATHRELYNLMYRLTPVDAYRDGLVKKIEVYGVREDDPGAFVFRVNDIRTRKNQTPQANVTLEVKTANGDYALKSFWLKSGADLFHRTNNAKYEELYVSDVDARLSSVELSNGDVNEQTEDTGENKEEIFRLQIRETIKAHMRKQDELGERMKVLSLFFIDRVDNYVPGDGLIRRLFEEEFEQQKKRSVFFKGLDARNVHNGYFAQKKRRDETIAVDTTGKSEADKEAYDLIMKKKERLLSFDEPTSFLFSHSALREGWDNPNVFQICTLNDTHTPMRKRQERSAEDYDCPSTRMEIACMTSGSTS